MAGEKVVPWASPKRGELYAPKNLLKFWPKPQLHNLYEVSETLEKFVFQLQIIVFCSLFFWHLIARSCDVYLTDSTVLDKLDNLEHNKISRQKKKPVNLSGPGWTSLNNEVQRGVDTALQSSK